MVLQRYSPSLNIGAHQLCPAVQLELVAPDTLLEYRHRPPSVLSASLTPGCSSLHAQLHSQNICCQAIACMDNDLSWSSSDIDATNTT